MSFEKELRNHKKTIENLLNDCRKTLEQPPNVIAQNKLIVITSILEKALMVTDEAIRSASLQPSEVEAILDRFTADSNQYGTNPALDEIDAMRREIENLQRAEDIMNAIRKRRDLSHRLVGHDQRLTKIFDKWIRTFESYKINQDISDKHRENLLSDVNSIRILLLGKR